MRPARGGGYRRARRGAGAAELAVVLPVLVLIALGCVDFGRFAYRYIAIQNAARTGAEYGTMNPYTTTTKAAWKTRVTAVTQAELADSAGTVPPGVAVDVPDADLVPESSGLRRVRVGVTYTGFTTLVSWPGIPSNPTMRSTVVMRAIR
jgi:Flp pilus assembly protein TadG